MGTEAGGKVRARTAPGQPNGERKHHDGIGNMIATSSHMIFLLISLEGVPEWVYSSRLFVSARTIKRSSS